jgi:hypothetical protein
MPDPFAIFRFNPRLPQAKLEIGLGSTENHYFTNMQIYVHCNNQQLGPFTEDEVKAKLAAGAISLQDHVWWQGHADWMPLGQSPLAANLSPAGSDSSGQRTSGLAIASLICGCFLCCGFFAALPAIVLGHISLSEIKRNPLVKGRGLALAGLILGYIGLISFVFVAIFYFMKIYENHMDFGKVQSSVITTEETATSSDVATNHALPAATNSDQMTNSQDQNVPATNAPDTGTNASPAGTSTNAMPAPNP